MVDDERDRARMDRRFARSTAGLTPMIFAEEMMRRSYNTSTAKIEEVDESSEPQQAAQARSSQSQAPLWVPAGGSMGPVSFGPTTHDA